MSKILFFLLGSLTSIVVIYFSSNRSILNDLEIINSKYSSVLNLIVSFLLMIITLAYVLLTYKLVRATNGSVEISEKVLKHSEKQLQLSKIPMLTINIEKVRGSFYFGRRRRQLHIDCLIENFGDGPAIDVYARSGILFQNIEYENKYEMYESTYIGTIATGEERQAKMHFETQKVEKLLEDWTISHNKNIQRIKNNPSQKPYPNPTLLIEVVYRNAFGQFFMSSRIHPMYDVITNNSKNNENCATTEGSNANKQKSQNQRSVFARGNGQLEDDESFEIIPINEIFSKSNFISISNEEGNKFIGIHKSLYEEVFNL